MRADRRPPRALILVALVAILALAPALGAVRVRARAATPGSPQVPLVVSAITAAVAQPFVIVDRARPARSLLVEIERAMSITRRPGGGPVVGTMPSGSRFYGIATVAWVREVSRDGRFGLVDVPYAGRHASGWISLRGLDRSWTRIGVVADLSEHRITVRRGDTVLFRAPAATGAPSSPTPVGRYFVTDRVPFPGGGVLGTFAFGISGIQPNLPAGWSGGDQLAIHGTNAPTSIGRSASAGCLRVAERILDRLKPLLRLGTPVIVRP